MKRKLFHLSFFIILSQVQYEFWKYDELGGYNITLQLKKIVFFTKDPVSFLQIVNAKEYLIMHF